ncbi:MAG TPA: hypothetical protein VFE51_11005 [Verrucomicrobiae bacterium]|nr:hypothetical protein [Verrucomicrobiae bacterium]
MTESQAFEEPAQTNSEPSAASPIQPAPTAAKKKGKPWKTIKGTCQTVPIYQYRTCGLRRFQVPIPGAKPPEKTRHTTTNLKIAVDLATTLANAPAKVAPTLAGVNPGLLVKAAEAVKKLEPILTPLEMSIHSGLEEYASIKARTGKLALPELIDSLLACGPATDAVSLVPRLKEIAAAIAKLVPVLEPLNISVASGIEEYAAVKTTVGAQDLRELLKQLASKPWVQKSKTSLAKVAKEFLAAKKHDAKSSGEYNKSLYYPMAGLVRLIEAESGIGASIGSVTTEQLKRFVFNPNRAPRGNSTYRTNVRTFFHWCQLHEYLDYGQPTAADRLEKIKIPPATPRILKVSEAKAILTELEEPWCLLYLVLSLFTGIRHDELQRATFEIIRPGRVVDIPAEISKTKKRRIIPIQSALNEWLAPFYGREGLVIPIANIQAKVAQFLKQSTAPGLPRRWGRNWLRQSFASYRLAQTGEVIETAKEDGHYAYILERVYLQLSSHEEALAFFALTPEACGKPDWKQRVKAFLADVPEVHARRKFKSRPWKQIGGDPDAVTPAAIDATAQAAA